jgi:hypothetical protein
VEVPSSRLADGKAPWFFREINRFGSVYLYIASDRPYRFKGEDHTFWLFTHEAGFCLIGKCQLVSRPPVRSIPTSVRVSPFVTCE